MEPDFPGSIYLRTYLVDPVYLTYAAFERAVLQAASRLDPLSCLHPTHMIYRRPQTAHPAKCPSEHPPHPLTRTNGS